MAPTTEVGHYPKRVYLSQEGSLVVPTSARVVFDQGAVLIDRRNLTTGITVPLTTNLNGVIPNKGVSVIKTTAATVISIRAITRDILGIEKLVLFDTTAIIELKASTVPSGGGGGLPIKFGSSHQTISMTSDIGKLAHKTVGQSFGLRLIPVSTDRWYALTVGSTAGLAKWTFSSST